MPVAAPLDAELTVVPPGEAAAAAVWLEDDAAAVPDAVLPLQVATLTAPVSPKVLPKSPLAGHWCHAGSPHSESPKRREVVV